MRELPTGTVTLLFTDIEESTHLLEQLGDRYTDMLTECRHLLRAAFGRWNGHEVDTQGDAFFVAFARATDAISAAVTAQRALASHPWPQGVMVCVRMGLHTGEPTLSSEGYVGLDVHRAARIMSAGHGGQILLSQTTRELVEHALPNGVSLLDLGERRLKDLQHPSHLFQLVILGLPTDFPPLKTLDTQPNNLPIQPTPFIGREKEVAAIQHHLCREGLRLLTLTGPGGTGKTRLGLQVAAELSDRFVDGIFFVALAPISDPALVVATIAETLGIREGPGQPLLERLKEQLQQKQVLLLLDNFEQVVSAASQVTDLLAACPQLKVVVTSREVLHMRAEHEFAVPPLALPDPKRLPDAVALSQYEAVALFLQRAQAVQPDFQLTTANARSVAEICARLDGLPLAIELAAARIKLLPPPALLARLEHRLAVLTSGARDVPVRQQTLRNTIAWSYHLLDAAEQRLFRRLSVFVGGFTLEAAEAVCSALGDGDGAVPVLDGVASLIDKSLLQHSEQSGEEGKEPRLWLLETIREYGLEYLMTSGEAEITRHAHTAYYLALAEKAEPKLFGGEQGVWLERLEQEHDNLRAALHWSAEHGEAETALRLGGALCGCWSVRGRLSEGRYWMERALTGSKEVVASVRAKALRGAGLLALSQHDHDRGEMLCGESLALYRELGDTRGMAISLNLLGHVAWVRRNYAAAHSLTEEALTFFNAMHDKGGIAWSLSALANVAIAEGEYTRARELSEESLALYRESGDKASIADALQHLARVVFSQGEYATVRSLVEESLAILREVDDKEGIGKSLCLLGQLVLHQRDAATARFLLAESLTVFREVGYRWGTAESLFFLANVAAFQRDYAAACGLYEESLAIFREVDEKWFIVSCLEGLGAAVAEQGQPAWAARLWGTAESLRNGTDLPIPYVGEASDPLLLLPVEHDRYEQTMAVARTQLGEEAFTAAWAEGRTMSLERALAAQEPVTLPQQLVKEPTSAPPARSAGYSAGLTEREVEVLLLVAQGLTNAQIAEQLIVSPHTVHAHVRSIHSKLGVTSRSAVTRYVFEHHLA